MHKFKKAMIFSVAAALCAGTLAACDTAFTHPTGIPEGDVVSNGGYVVQKGEYVYFINGVDAYTSDNTYGTPVKGALMRAKKADLLAGKNEAETVIPSLMVAADYTSGLYIYGDRIYYATPNNVKNTDGVIESDYLDFKSAKLDGSDIQNYFNVDDNATVYRFVQDGDTVYVVYADDSDLHSYNTSTKVDTVLAKGTESYVVSSADKTDPVIYYTMGVTDDIDTDNPNTCSYKQIYRVSASATEAPYTYEYSQKYLDEHDGEAPYHNLGTLILDGVGANGEPTMFTHDLNEENQPLTPNGYTYNLLTYTNGGLYFTRKEVTSTSTQGEGGWLYYLSADKLASGWNSVSGNRESNFDVIAQNTDKASSSAIFYLDEKGHHYLYVDGQSIYRADVGENGVAETVNIARNVSGATLMYTDTTSDPAYDYLYFTRSNGSGNSVERAVFNGTQEDYSNLLKKDEYQPVKALDLQHAGSWYNYEVVDGIVYIADAEQIGSTSYNYLAAVDLTKDGKLMNNAEIKAWSEQYQEVVDYIADLKEDKEDLATAIDVYFHTAKDSYFYDNIAYAKEEGGKKDDYLYSTEDQAAFKAYVEGKEGETDLAFKDVRTRNAFILPIGAVNEKDAEDIDTQWKNTLEHYTAPEEEDTSLPVWAWVLIGVGAAIVVAAAILIPVLVTRSRKKKLAEAEKKPKMYVETQVDPTEDVYAPVEEETAPEEAPAEEPATEEAAPQEEPVPEEAPAEEAASEAEQPETKDDAPDSEA